MPVLDYATPVSRRCGWPWWIAAVASGAASGWGVAQAAYEPLLRFLSRGSQLVVYEVTEPYLQLLQFTTAFMLCGVLVAVGAVAAVHLVGRHNGAVWAAALAVIFVIGALLGLLYARSTWNPTEALLLPKGIGGMPLESAPILTAPVAGSIAVLVALGALALRRFKAGQPAA